MTKRKSATPQKRHGSRSPSSDPLNPAHFPLFAEFVRGYLHQDVVPEYGNAIAAAKAYLADLNVKDLAALAKEATALRHALADKTIAALNTELRSLGSQWNFTSTAEFETMLAILIPK